MHSCHATSLGTKRKHSRVGTGPPHPSAAAPCHEKRHDKKARGPSLGEIALIAESTCCAPTVPVTVTCGIFCRRAPSDLRLRRRRTSPSGLSFHGSFGVSRRLISRSRMSRLFAATAVPHSALVVLSFSFAHSRTTSGATRCLSSMGAWTTDPLRLSTGRAKVPPRDPVPSVTRRCGDGVSTSTTTGPLLRTNLSASTGEHHAVFRQA